MPGMSASGESVSTSAHASPACTSLPRSCDACRAASVGYTRRLDMSPHFAHCTWSTYGGPGTASADATGARAKGTVAAAIAAAKKRRTRLAGLALDFQDLRPDVDEIDACGHGRDRHPGDAEHQGQQHTDAEDHQPDGLGQLVGGGVGVRPLQRGVNERVDGRHHDRDLQNTEEVTHYALKLHIASLSGLRPRVDSESPLRAT